MINISKLDIICILLTIIFIFIYNEYNNCENFTLSSNITTKPDVLTDSNTNNIIMCDPRSNPPQKCPGNIDCPNCGSNNGHCPCPSDLNHNSLNLILLIVI